MEKYFEDYEKYKYKRGHYDELAICNYLGIETTYCSFLFIPELRLLLRDGEIDDLSDGYDTLYYNAEASRLCMVCPAMWVKFK